MSACAGVRAFVVLACCAVLNCGCSVGRSVEITSTQEPDVSRSDQFSMLKKVLCVRLFAGLPFPASSH